MVPMKKFQPFNFAIKILAPLVWIFSALKTFKISKWYFLSSSSPIAVEDKLLRGSRIKLELDSRRNLSSATTGDGNDRRANFISKIFFFCHSRPDRESSTNQSGDWIPAFARTTIGIVVFAVVVLGFFIAPNFSTINSF